MTRSCVSLDKELHVHHIYKTDELRDDCECGNSSEETTEMNMALNQLTSFNEAQAAYKSVKSLSYTHTQQRKV